MSCDSWNRILDSLLPLVDVLGLAIVGLAVSRIRSISGDVRSTSQAAEMNSVLLHALLARSGYPPPAPDPKK